jgi:hypothetical protein
MFAIEPRARDIQFAVFGESAAKRHLRLDAEAPKSKGGYQCHRH